VIYFSSLVTNQPIRAIPEFIGLCQFDLFDARRSRVLSRPSRRHTRHHSIRRCRPIPFRILQAHLGDAISSSQPICSAAVRIRCSIKHLRSIGCVSRSYHGGKLVLIPGSYPFQLVRTRLQSQGMPGRPIRYTSVIDCFQRTIEQDGVRGLYRGLQPNFLKALPSISISYAIYDLTYRHLEGRVTR
jgi:hypothetical protein